MTTASGTRRAGRSAAVVWRELSFSSSSPADRGQETLYQLSQYLYLIPRLFVSVLSLPAFHCPPPPSPNIPSLFLFIPSAPALVPPQSLDILLFPPSPLRPCLLVPSVSSAHVHPLQYPGYISRFSPPPPPPSCALEKKSLPRRQCLAPTAYLLLILTPEDPGDYRRILADHHLDTMFSAANFHGRSAFAKIAGDPRLFST